MPAKYTTNVLCGQLVFVLSAGVVTGACFAPDGSSSSRADGNQGVAHSTLITAPARDHSAVPNTLQPPFDVGAVVRRIHFSFRAAAGGVHQGGHSSYGVHVSGAGRVKVTPVRHGRTPSAERGARTAADPGAAQVRRGEPVYGAPLTLETVEVTCAGLRLATAQADVSVEADGSLAIQRGAVRERLRNTEAGVEQSWRFSTRPCAGHLTVRVGVSGHAYAGATGRGLHFVDRATGIGLRMGWATWVDARGKRTAVRGKYSGGAVVLRVPSAVLRSSTFPAILDPLISPEFGLDKPLSGPAWANQSRPRVTHDGTNYVAVWQDYRNVKTSSWDIYGARVSASGKLLDTAGILISSAPGHQQAPQVGSGKGTSLVVWQDYRNNATYPDIYSARVSSAGTVLDPKGLAISTASSYQYSPSVTFGGGLFLVVWQDYRKGAYADIFGARVSLAGALQDTGGISISTATRHQYSPSVTYGGGYFFVAWTDYRKSASYPDVYGARLTANGALQDASGIPISVAAYHQSSPSVAFGGINYFVVWQDYRDYKKTAWDVYGARVSTSGNLQDASGIPISKAASHQLYPSVAHDGSGYLVAWQDYRTSSTTSYDIYGSRVSTAGVVQSSAGTGIAYAVGDQQYPSVAAGASGFFVVWEDQRNSASIKNDIYGARVTSTGTVMDPAGLLVSSAANNQLSPAVAHDGTNYLVVWQDYKSYTVSANDIHGALVSAKGVLISKSGVSVATSTGDQLAPAVAFGGQKYLVVWQDKGDIYGAQVDKSGKLMHPSGVPLCTAANNQLAPAVAAGKSGYLVAWQDHRKSTTYADIYGVRVNTYGGLVDSKAIAIGAAPYSQERPALAFDGTNYLVVWQDARTSSFSSWDIYGARVSQAGTVLDTTGIAVSAPLLNQQRPALARGKSGFFVVWQDDRNKTNSSWDVYGARVSFAGAVLDTSGIAISSATTDEVQPTVAFGGDDYLVAWQDLRNGKDNTDLYGTQVSSAGVVQAALGLPIATSSSAEMSPALASTGNKSYLLVYSRFALESPLGAYRILGRVVTPTAASGAACASAKNCLSGFCVDGVCCDTACGGGSPADCQACSAASKSAGPDGTCGPVKAGASCRPAAGPCDTAESCDGKNTTCPVDTLAPSSTTCRGAQSACDTAETCSGTSASCPADSFAAAATVCRAKAGACDVAETCSGSSASCPADTFAASTITCRASAGVCDVAETCSGTSALCPANSFAAATTSCRAAAGVCDAAELCTGASALCPGDLFKLPGAVCRAAVGQCDVAETCTGSGFACPADALKADGTACTSGQCKSGKCVSADAGPPDQGHEAGVDIAAPDSGTDQGAEASPGTDQGADLSGKEGGSAGDLPATTDCPEGCSCDLDGGAGHGPLGVLLLALLWGASRRRRARE